ncbi:CYTH and CHAD domain-containing protein [Mycolicibacterium sp. 018/SC-01/001]|uniref:CYTH and CHAD domain-containing protein n=1 Tax=Mycolicibacterium sp. 018/SC-01/001 TaxID=2592069 RepID=UPI00117DEDAE|nr:CYTH and CHAD domain-containing protein [Mycolicibacterium sp. 018/SC-01/001]TRW88246.1 CYTH and CHAD domain-containing protein [Mycolicibacterium sp. 018/SC-01/001]
MPARPSDISRYTETERKFDVDDATVSPSFEGLAAVSRSERSPSQSLDAVYYDTSAHDLARHRITLRRRIGGTDAGWHLKLPAGQDSRTEVRVPLEDGAPAHPQVPDELRDVVLAIVRGRGLAPVARISTVRDVTMLYGPDGSAVAEFCDDHVTAGAVGGDEQYWREWELELVEGADRALFKPLTRRLLDAGARPAGHGSKLARVLETPADDGPEVPDDPVHRAVAEQVAELIAWDRAVRSDVYDSVHQMRVTTRKIRSLLQSSEGAFGITDDAWVLGELRELAAVLGVARDAEVLAERYEQALDGLPDDLVRGPVRERLVEGAKKRYQTGWKRSLAAMRTPRYFRLLDALEELATTEPSLAPGEERAEVTIGAAYKRVRKAAAKAEDEVGGEHADEALHKIRKRAKQLRYTAAATGKSKVADRAKSIQSLLGDHQDSVVSRSHLIRQAEQAHAAGEDTFTYGLLYQQEHDLAVRCEEQVADALDELARAVKKS